MPPELTEGTELYDPLEPVELPVDEPAVGDELLVLTCWLGVTFAAADLSWCVASCPTRPAVTSVPAAMPATVKRRVLRRIGIIGVLFLGGETSETDRPSSGDLLSCLWTG